VSKTAAEDELRTRDRLLLVLKKRGPHTAGELAGRLGVTPEAVRQHLAQLEDEGLVGARSEPSGVGRPARRFSLTQDAEACFPDAHADLTVELLGSLQRSLGEDGMAKLLAGRTREQLRRYRAELPGVGVPLASRIAALAALREREGYMAEWSEQEDGSYLLVENHCPICVAAAACQGLCAEELSLFRRVLGARVERTQHLLGGARRCEYRIEERRAVTGRVA
jgi:predicted ArsR family transcriptional regulator